ncbi:LysR family transcriptional regulator [Chitinimonas sp. PSY-7]|uniref:LysR substrate-binding domain-containing protein n=1 Tax=Chitinimonas sp. PSY-7 TaxID=3459088 RepID=UPI0040403261
MNHQLELRHLRTIAALFDAGGVARAAERLNLTQSALSHQLKQLEDHFGLSLFERKSQPLKLSPAGQRLHALAQSVLPAVADTCRDIARIRDGAAGNLRVAVECHTCFDWLMPAMDEFRPRWPEVELDIVSGFHADPVGLIHQDEADVAIVSEKDADEPMHYFPLFRYEIVGLLANDHALAGKSQLDAADFANETLISYPIPDDMLDIMRQVLRPAGITPKRRSSELTVAILQLVASRRGVAALPAWAVAPYLERRYVTALPITNQHLYGELYAAVPKGRAGLAYVEDFVDTVKATCAASLPGIELL